MTIYILNIATIGAITIILALSLDFIMGHAGVFSMAHAIFYATGAYTAALLSLHVTQDLFVILVIAGLISSLLSLVLASIALRIRGEYFVVASLGLQMIGVTILMRWHSVTGGVGGITGIPDPLIFGYPIHRAADMFILVSCVLLICVFSLRRLLRSRLGRAMRAIRDNETAAIQYGKSSVGVKIEAIAIASFMAGLAGALYAFYVRFVNPESFLLEVSVLLAAMAVIGGSGTLIGPIIGAAVLTLLPNMITFIPLVPSGLIGELQQMMYGLIVVLLVIWRPAGLWRLDVERGLKSIDTKD